MLVMMVNDDVYTNIIKVLYLFIIHGSGRYLNDNSIMYSEYVMRMNICIQLSMSVFQRDNAVVVFKIGNN